MKIKSKTLPYGFRNFSVKYEKGGELSNWGALRNLPQEASGQQAPPFSYFTEKLRKPYGSVSDLIFIFFSLPFHQC